MIPLSPSIRSIRYVAKRALAHLFRQEKLCQRRIARQKRFSFPRKLRYLTFVLFFNSKRVKNAH
ncbi:hypothetical protein ABEW03_20890, partial [Virgibacillus pantothenticus]|uniref:hypothetical protein n=1 Tax=Virgibacillus pantothenticus TaxID=1473 RepID=UPI003D2BDF1F